MNHINCPICRDKAFLADLRESALWRSLAKVTPVTGEDDPALYGTDFDEMLDDPRRGQAELFNGSR